MELLLLIIPAVIGLNVFVWYSSSIINPSGRSNYPPVLWKFSGHVKSWIAILIGFAALIFIFQRSKDFYHFGGIFLLLLIIILIRKSFKTPFHLPFSSEMNELFSRTGYKFGGYSRQQFLDETKELYAHDSGIREKILGEAYYLIWWIQRELEIGFLFGIMYHKSLLIAILYSAILFILEFNRFYTFGASNFYSKFCRFWNWIKVPIFLYSIIIMWSRDFFLSTSLILFIILQGWLGLYSLTVMLPFRLVGISIITRKYGLGWANYEIAALWFVINKWKQKLGVKL